MLSPETQPVFDSHVTHGANREEKRLQTLIDLGLLEVGNVPIFEEATQTAAHLLEIPICVLGLVEQERERFQAAVGLSRMGLMNDLATTRQVARRDSLASRIVQSQQVLAIANMAAQPDFSENLLVQRYGIRSYLGVPLIAWNGHCLGALAVMDSEPHDFTRRDIESLQMIARWSISEYERNYLLQRQSLNSRSVFANLNPDVASAKAATVRVNLISQMTQELRTPLTSILGMTSVLTREIYGPLTDKQKEYMGIIHNSGQYLLSLANEILELGAGKDDPQDLRFSPVDIEMLCQQALQTLKEAADRRDQQIRLTVEPSSRIWLLDKDKVRQMLYHLAFSIIQAASTESILRVHVSRKGSRLNLTVWISHPWLGEGLPQVDGFEEPGMTDQLEYATDSAIAESMGDRFRKSEYLEDEKGAVQADPTFENTTDNPTSHKRSSRQSLGLALSHHLAELHGGQITLQGTAATGYRYVISLPEINETNGMDEMGINY